MLDLIAEKGSSVTRSVPVIPVKRCAPIIRSSKYGRLNAAVQDYLHSMFDYKGSIGIDDIPLLTSILERTIRSLGFRYFIFEIFSPSRGTEMMWQSRCMLSNLETSANVEKNSVLLTKLMLRVSSNHAPFLIENIKDFYGDVDGVYAADDRCQPAPIVIPVHSACGELSALTLIPEVTLPLLRISAEIYDSIYLITCHFLAHVGKILIEKALINGSKRKSSLLSKREKTVLEWSARGKSTADIAIILDLSQKSVDFHIEGCKRKLNVFNRTHAVAKAILLGLLSFEC